MSIRLHLCPNTDKIVCDTGYSAREMTRQAIATSASYVKSIFQVSTECKCDPNQCERYLNKMKQLAQQKTK